MNKLTTDDVRLIRELISERRRLERISSEEREKSRMAHDRSLKYRREANAINNGVIGEKFGTSTDYIREIANGRRRKHG